MYIRDNITFKPRPDLSTEGLETLWVEFCLPKTASILIAVCYRPPTQSNFYTLLE